MTDSNKALTIFQNKDFGTLSVIEYKGEPYFIGKEVAGKLGYKDTNDAIKQHCKKQIVVKAKDLGDLELKGESPLSYFGQRGATLIPKSDLFRLISRSNLPAAEEFMDWVFEEVLPSIEKHGLN